MSTVWTRPAPGSLQAALLILGCLMVPGIVATLAGGSSAGIAVGVAGGSAMAFGAVLDARRSLAYVAVVAGVAAVATVVSGQPLPAALVVGASALLVGVANTTSVGIFALVPVLAVLFAAVDRGLPWWAAAGWTALGGVSGLAVLRVMKASAPPRPLTARHAWRHAVALAVTAAATFYVALAWDLPHGYWVTVTLLVALRPIAGERRTILRARLWGTLIGALLAVAIAAALPPAWSLVAALACLVLLAAYAISDNYFLQTVFLTPMLLLFASAGDDTEALASTVQRVAFTLVGVLVAAVLVVLLAWWDARDEVG